MQERVLGVDVVRAHGQLVAVQRVAHRDLARAGGVDPPGLLVDLCHAARAALVPGLEVAHEPRVIADQITSRAPGRQRDVGGVRIGSKRQLDLDEVTLWRPDAHGIAKRHTP